MALLSTAVREDAQPAPNALTIQTEETYETRSVTVKLLRKNGERERKSKCESDASIAHRRKDANIKFKYI